MSVNIYGKEYKTVAERVNLFRASHPEWTIQNAIISIDDKAVVVRSEIIDDKGRLIASGLAEESRNSSNINKTSALENCETSAVGRALAFFGLAGSEIASANEVQNAIAQETKQAPAKPATPEQVVTLENYASTEDDPEKVKWINLQIKSELTFDHANIIINKIREARK